MLKSVRLLSILFQSTLPTRGSDYLPFPAQRLSWRVSIHAPHEGERPSALFSASVTRGSFNPRSPRGGATLIIAD